MNTVPASPARMIKAISHLNVAGGSAVEVKRSSRQLTVMLNHIVLMAANLVRIGISLVPSRYGRYLAKSRLRISRRSSHGELLVNMSDASNSGPTVGMPGRKTPTAASTTNPTPSAARNICRTVIFCFSTGGGAGWLGSALVDGVSNWFIYFGEPVMGLLMMCGLRVPIWKIG